MDTLSYTLHHVIFHPLFTILLLFCLAGLLGAIVAVWVRLGDTDPTFSSPPDQSASSQHEGQLRGAHPGSSGR
jgi:hypothetical protein